MSRCRLFCVIVLMLTCPDVFSQVPQIAFRVAFTDKAGSPEVTAATVFLSSRALDRRQRRNITVDETDRPVSSLYLDSVLSLTGGKLHVTSRWLNQCVVLLEDSSRILALNNLSFVRSVQLVAYYAGGLHLPSPDAYEGKFASEAMISFPPVLQRSTAGADSLSYGYAYRQTDMVNGHELHKLGYRGEGILIAVLDAGFEGTDMHPGFDSLRHSGRIVDTYDFVLNDDEVYHHDSHGTGVLAPLAGNIPREYLGAAPDAMYALYRTEDNYSEQFIEIDNLIAGAERADSIGADIINVSLGYDFFDFPAGVNISQSEMDGSTTISARAANMAVQKGMLLVATSGNEGSTGLLTPGEADSVLTVGAVDRDGNAAGFSSWGPNASGRVKPDVSVLGSPAMIFSNSGIAGAGGTSFAAPQIAGWAACLWQARPDITVSDIRDVMIRSADRYTAPDRQKGYGIPDFRIAGILLKVVDTVKTPHPFDFMALWPTVFREGETVRIILDPPVDQQIRFGLFDVSGRLLWHYEQYFLSGRQYYELTLPSRLPAGMYLFRATGNGQARTVKMVHY